ncbi:MAG: HAD-IA family hydrolase [Burkholderiales bacterium]
MSGHYADFWQSTEDALVFAAKMLKLDLTPDKRKRLMEAYLELKAWPDVPLALKSLKEAGIRMAFLSNFTPRMLDAGIKSARLEGIFERLLSTDNIKTYKPDPRAYQMDRRVRAEARRNCVCCFRRLGCSRREIVWLPDFLG